MEKYYREETLRAIEESNLNEVAKVNLTLMVSNCEKIDFQNNQQVNKKDIILRYKGRKIFLEFFSDLAFLTVGDTISNIAENDILLEFLVHEL